MLKIFEFNSTKIKSLVNLQQSRTYVRRIKDPGISRRLKLFSEDFVKNDPEIIESIEPDFSNVGQAHKDFEAEEKLFKEKLSTRIVGRKYFNEKQINFLTWSEKEQIRMLSQKEEWTIEKLSESFPADPLAITKIIRNKWYPKDSNRVQKHDESVKRSWSKFISGELKLDPILEQHLKKFTHRDLDNMSKPKEYRKFGVEIPKPRSNEFSTIISSCKKYTENLRKNEKERDQSKVVQLESNELRFPKDRSMNPEEDSFILQGKSKTGTNKIMTLKAYEKFSPEISTAINEYQNTMKSSALIEEPFSLENVDKFEKNVTTIAGDNSKVFESLEIKNEITIPRKLWKKNQIYKVGDCFYSDDGEFLYRVPGLS